MNPYLCVHLLLMVAMWRTKAVNSGVEGELALVEDQKGGDVHCGETPVER